MIGSCWVHRGTGGSAHPKELREGWDVPFIQTSSLLLVSPTKHWSQHPPHSISLPRGCCVPGMSCPPKSFKNADHCLKLAIPKNNNNKKKEKMLKRSSCKHLKNTVVQDKDTPPPATFLHQIPSGLCSLGSNQASHHPEHSVIHQPKRTRGNSAYVCCSCQSVSLCTDREREQRSLTVDRLIIHLFSPYIMRKRKSHNSRASLRVL